MDCSFLTHIAFNGLTLAQADASSGLFGISWSQWGALAVVAAVLILPFVIGNVLAKSLKMPNYGTRLGWVLLAVAASAVVLANKRPGLGVDLSGGTILVYELNPEQLRNLVEQGGQRIKSEDLIEPLTRRINPSGTQEIVIRPYGEKQIEIIVPEVDQLEVDRIKKLIEEAGVLRFAIVGNPVDHAGEFEAARLQASSSEPGVRTRTSVDNQSGEQVAIWANVDREKTGAEGSVLPFRVDVSRGLVRNGSTGEILDVPRSDGDGQALADWAESKDISKIDVLMIFEPDLDIQGRDLAFAASTFDQNGSPAVAFTLTDQGSGMFFALTTNNAPVGERQRQLGIVLDNNLLSAPNILQPIRKDGRITGNFTREEVQSLVQILKAGQLPTALTKQPIAENQIDATLGDDTIAKGVKAISASLALVLLFILVYYRFAGAVACIALVMNLAMILGTMVLINQPLTLPGLAGLVLTVGMSVDANVLIFERIREELKKGAASRMAIRNGFAKATVTIIDANLTTLITAIVLYAIGTDQIRGFAVTLILGILFSMFTAIYVSRTLFDIAERHGRVSLKMSDIVNSIRASISNEDGLDFIGKGKITLAVSAILLIIGVASLVARGKGIFDIDFAGGSSVQFRVSSETPTDEIRAIIGSAMVSEEKEKIPFTVNGVKLDGVPDRTVYKVDSSLEKVDDLKTKVADAFKASDRELVTYNVTITPPVDSAPQSRIGPLGNGAVLTAAPLQEPDAAAPQEPDAAAPQEPDAAAPQEPDAAAPQEPDAAAPQEPDAAAPVSAQGEAVPSADVPPATPALTPPAAVRIPHEIRLGIGGESAGRAQANRSTLEETLISAAEQAKVPLTAANITLTPLGEGADAWEAESQLPFSKWEVVLDLPTLEANEVMRQLEASMSAEPVWISSSSVGSRVAEDMIGRAFGALFASLLCIIGYIWFRFQRVIYGFAAVAALLHDVLITLGAIAVSYWLASSLGFLLIDPFKISLTVVAAILTIIGYSLNDTIVVFDRIRETKGKAPRLTGEMINSSINQTLSRTLLTSLTTLIVVLLLYWFGGEGIHAFAFALVVGVIAGTYSSIFIASPILLFFIRQGDKPKAA